MIFYKKSRNFTFSKKKLSKCCKVGILLLTSQFQVNFTQLYQNMELKLNYTTAHAKPSDGSKHEISHHTCQSPANAYTAP